MIARFINYTGLLDAETIGLVLAPPNWRQLPKLDLSFPTDVAHHAISARESRRAFSKSARYSVEFVSTLKNVADATELRIFLNALNVDQTVAIPLWTDGTQLKNAVSAGATSAVLTVTPVRYGTEWIAINSDSSLYEIFQSTSPGVISAPGFANNWPAGTWIYPLIFGRLNGRPDATSVGPSRSEFALKFKENSPFERRITTRTVSPATVGSQVSNLSSLPLWTIQPTWIRVLDRSEVETAWSELGFGREDAVTAYDRPVARGLEMQFNCRTRNEIAAVEYFFRSVRGQVTSFMIPTFRNDLQLSIDLPDGGNPKHIAIAQPNEYSDAGRAPHPGDPYIALVDPLNINADQTTQSTVDPHKVDIVAAGDLTTDVNVTATHKKSLARISHLLLCRLADPKLSWTYKIQGRALVTLKFIELPFEYALPSPALKDEATLYIFEELKKYPSIVRVTSYEDEIVIASGVYAGTYTPANVGSGSNRHSTDLTAQKLDLKTGAFTGNPISKFFPWKLEGLLKCTVLTVNANDLTEAPKVRFTGQVGEPNPALTESTVKPFGDLLDLQIPCRLLMAVDNFVLGDAALGIDPDTYKITGPIAAIAGNVITVTAAAAFAKAADYFADGGYIDVGADADHYESRSVLHSAPHAPDKVDLTLERPLNFNVVGASVDIFPGYDGTIDQLETRFAAREVFGGFPFVPDTPPNIKAVETKTPGSGKGGK